MVIACHLSWRGTSLREWGPFPAWEASRSELAGGLMAGTESTAICCRPGRSAACDVMNICFMIYLWRATKEETDRQDAMSELVNDLSCI